MNNTFVTQDFEIYLSDRSFLYDDRESNESILLYLENTSQYSIHGKCFTFNYNSINNYVTFDKSLILSHLFQFSSVFQSCPTICNPMKCSTPGLPVHHQLLEFTQTHVH